MGDDLALLQERLQLSFAQPSLLERALTHRSFSADHNERLEFLGDSVLNLAVADLLYARLGTLAEGDLSRIRANLVKQDTLHQLALDLGLSGLLRLGDGEIRSGGQKRPSILADALEAAMEKEGRRPTLLIEVNTGEEPQKSGVSRAEADAFIEASKARFGTTLAGLMCVPPQGEDPAPHFAWLAACAQRHGLGVVSMGMSADFETAIAHGATWVRVGSAIFGSR